VTYIKISDSDRPLCPNMGYPGNEAHHLRTRILNTFYEAAPKDSDGEMSEELDKVYSAAAYGGNTDERMNLYSEFVNVYQGTNVTQVTTWWFKCPICGFILPATAKEIL
jgi:hypothetical protein